MPLNIIADFFNFINIPLFDAATVLLIISFIIWELPRSVKLMDEEYTKGIYPDGGRVPDILLFVVGLACAGYFLLGDTAEKIVAFLHTPGVTALYIIILITIPIIIALGFFKRFFARMDKHESITIFLVHGFLDLFHTTFFIGVTMLVVPVAGFLIGLH